jgi:hypothetical protein
MSLLDLPKPLAPGRKWGTVNHAMHGMGFALHDEDDENICTLWNLYKNSGLWSVWIHDRPAWMTGRTIVDLGRHDNPPFELAEAMADAAK